MFSSIPWRRNLDRLDCGSNAATLFRLETDTLIIMIDLIIKINVTYTLITQLAQNLSGNARNRQERLPNHLSENLCTIHFQSRFHFEPKSMLSTWSREYAANLLQHIQRETNRRYKANHSRSGYWRCSHFRQAHSTHRDWWLMLRAISYILDMHASCFIVKNCSQNSSLAATLSPRFALGDTLSKHSKAVTMLPCCCLSSCHLFCFCLHFSQAHFQLCLDDPAGRRLSHDPV